jgi:putative flippase GtrA
MLLISAYNILFNPLQIFTDPAYYVPFRDLPLDSVLFTPFLPFGFNVGYCLFCLLSFIATIYLTFRIYRYLVKKQLNSKVNIAILAIVVLLNPIALQNYWLGNVTSFSVLLLWLVFEQFLQQESALKCGIYFAIAVLIKPIALTLVPILLPIQLINKKLFINWKAGIRFYSGLFVIVILHILFFLIYPQLLTKYIAINSTPADIKLSESLTYFISLVYNNSNSNIIFIAGIAISSVWLLYERLINQTSFTFCFLMGIFNAIVFFTTSWTIYLLILSPFAMIFLLDLDAKNFISKKLLYTFIFFIFSMQFIDFLYNLFNIKIIPILYVIFYIFCIFKIKQEMKSNIIENSRIIMEISLLGKKIVIEDSLLRFLIVGGLGIFTNLLVFDLTIFIFQSYSNVSSLIASDVGSVLAFFIASIQNYILNHLWSFKADVNYGINFKSYFKYLVVNLGGLLINLGMLDLILYLFPSCPQEIAQLIGILLAFIFNYIGSKFFVFKMQSKKITNDTPISEMNKDEDGVDQA